MNENVCVNTCLTVLKSSSFVLSDHNILVIFYLKILDSNETSANQGMHYDSSLKIM